MKLYGSVESVVAATGLLRDRRRILKMLVRCESRPRQASEFVSFSLLLTVRSSRLQVDGRHQPSFPLVVVFLDGCRVPSGPKDS